MRRSQYFINSAQNIGKNKWYSEGAKSGEYTMDGASVPS